MLPRLCKPVDEKNDVSSWFIVFHFGVLIAYIGVYLALKCFRGAGLSDRIPEKHLVRGIFILAKVFWRQVV